MSTSDKSQRFFLNRFFQRVLIGLVVFYMFGALGFGASRFDDAMEAFQRGKMARAQKLLERILSAPKLEQEDAAMFLLIRVHLARRNEARAADIAERFVKRFPDSPYFDDAHYAMAEAHFLRGDLVRCAQVLAWVIENAPDERLQQKARIVLPQLAKKARSEEEIARLEEVSAIPVPSEFPISSGAVVVLLAFPDRDAPEARALRRAMEFAAARGHLRFPVVFHEVVSSHECAQTAIRLFENETVGLVVFAGDEGSATTLAVLSKQYQTPVLFLTGYTSSLCDLSDYLFEFMPSRKTQGFALGKYAGEELEIRSVLELVVDDEEGRALEAGFREGAEETGAAVVGREWFLPTAHSIRAPLRDLFTPPRGENEPEGLLSTALTDSEMAALWGTSKGEVLLLKEEDSLMTITRTSAPKGKRALFFCIPSGRASNMISQMGTLPRRTTFLGNSAWIDIEALKEYPEISDGLIIAAPLLPEVKFRGLMQQVYEDSIGQKASLWELLGIDAAKFVGEIVSTKPESRNAFKEALEQTEPFFGTSVQLDFMGGRENQAVRILKYKNKSFLILK